MYKHPILLSVFLMYALAATASIIIGAVLIESSLPSFALIETFDSLEDEKSPINIMSPTDRQDLGYIQKSYVVIGSLAVIFSLVFVWNAVDLFIIMVCGKTDLGNSHCFLYDFFIKKEIRDIVGQAGQQRNLTTTL